MSLGRLIFAPPHDIVVEQQMNLAVLASIKYILRVSDRKPRYPGVTGERTFDLFREVFIFPAVLDQRVLGVLMNVVIGRYVVNVQLVIGGGREGCDPR